MRGNKRMAQLVFMFSDITGKTEQESRQIIDTTITGRAVRDGNAAVLYEQQTENLCSIAMELEQKEEYRDLAVVFSNEAIVKAMKNLEEKESLTPEEGFFQFHRSEDLKEKIKKENKIRMKEMMKIKQQNRINIGRM